MPRFHYDTRKGRFRDWLRSILVNRLRHFWRAERSRPAATGDSDFLHQVLSQLADPGSSLSQLWDREHDRHIAQHLLAVVEGEFSTTTWQAFQGIMAGKKAAEVAAELDVSLNVVYLAKSLVLKRLRQEMNGLTE